MSDLVPWAADLGGGVRVSLLRTETHRVDAGALFGPVPRLLWARVVGDELDENHRVVLAFNTLLVETSDARILLDPGGGDMDPESEPSAGGPGIVAALEAAGVARASIDLVVASSLRRRHVGALLGPDGAPAFPRATLVAQTAEWSVAARENERVRMTYDPAMLAALGAAMPARRLDGDAEVAPGIAVVATGGVSAGHQAILIRGSGGPTVAFLGDLLMRPWQANPRWITAWDDFPLESVRVKTELFGRAAAEDWTVVCSHEPSVAVGRLVPDRDRYRFEPLG